MHFYLNKNATHNVTLAATKDGLDVTFRRLLRQYQLWSSILEHPCVCLMLISSRPSANKFYSLNIIFTGYYVTGRHSTGNHHLNRKCGGVNLGHVQRKLQMNKFLAHKCI